MTPEQSLLAAEFRARRDLYDTAADLIVDLAADRGIDLDDDEALANFTQSVEGALEATR